MKKKVCKDCKMFYDGSQCPNCKSTQSSINWQGRITITNSKKSDIAKLMGLGKEGEYAIKYR